MTTLQQRITIDYEYTGYFIASVKHAVIDIGIRKGYFQKANYKEPKEKVRKNAILLGVVGILIIIFGNLISYQTRLDLAFGAFFILGAAFIGAAIYRIWSSGNYVLLSQFGEDEYAKWRGLYNFLNSETLMKERTVVDIVIWEKYLVYATAFGISEKVIKALQIRCSEAAIRASRMLSNPCYRSKGFYRSSRSFRSGTRSASRSSRSGGGGGRGGSSGGGFGGGGRGGGGH